MRWRLLATAAGCLGGLAGGAVAASHYLNDPAPPARQTPILFLAAAQHEVRPSWPPITARVPFNDEMHALLTMGATVGTAAAAHRPSTEASEPRRQTSAEERRRLRQEERARRVERAMAQAAREARDARAQALQDEGVEIYVRDRHGNRLRMMRVQREREAEPAVAPGSIRRTGPFGEW